MDVFCRIAIEKGFVTREQVEKALEVQKQTRENTAASKTESGRIRQKLIGVILVELGFMAPPQLMEVLAAADAAVAAPAPA